MKQNLWIFRAFCVLFCFFFFFFFFFFGGKWPAWCLLNLLFLFFHFESCRAQIPRQSKQAGPQFTSNLNLFEKKPFFNWVWGIGLRKLTLILKWEAIRFNESKIFPQSAFDVGNLMSTKWNLLGKACCIFCCWDKSFWVKRKIPCNLCPSYSIKVL